MHSATPEPARNLAGGLWLIADMCLNIWALSIVKAVGLDFPPTQIVLLRAVTGLTLMLPWIWRERAAFAKPDDLPLHMLRVMLSTITLTASFFAIARVPFALFTAMNFTRPLALMAMAALFLSERVTPRRWLAGMVALVGVLIAVDPSGTGSLNWGLPALVLTILAGTGAVIVTRRLKSAPTIVLMTFYTGGLAVLISPFALASWQEVSAEEWPALLAVGLFAQSAQFCFLQAHKRAEASFLAVLGYGSLVISAAVGYTIFNEPISLRFVLGACMIICAAAWGTVFATRRTGV